MIYLLSQMSLIILLSAIAGGALGWVLQRLKGQQRVTQLQQGIVQQQQQVKQAQTDVSMLAQDYDELKQSSASTIDNLRLDNQQIPNLHQNLEKSQLLVRQLMQKHEAQIREYASENEVLKGKIKHLDDRERALNKLQADVEQGRREINKAREENAAASGASPDTKTPDSNQAISPAPTQTPASPTAEKSSDNNPVKNPDTNNTGVNSADKSSASEVSADDEALPTVQQIDTRKESPLTHADMLPPSNAGGKVRVNTTSQSIAELTERAREKAEREKAASLDMSADVSGEAGSLTVALAEADLVLAAIDKKREEPQQTIADDEVIDASDIDFDMEFADAMNDLDGSETLFDPVDQHDDLQTIFGIGPVTEQGLNRLGITSYSQLAELKRHDIERIANALEIVPGKIERENWVGNARRQLEDVLEEL